MTYNRTRNRPATVEDVARAAREAGSAMGDRVLSKVEDMLDDARKRDVPDRSGLPLPPYDQTLGGDGTARSYGSGGRLTEGWELELQHASRGWSDQEKRAYTPQACLETREFFRAIIENDQAMLREIYDRPENRANPEISRALTTGAGGDGMVTTGFDRQVALISTRVAKMRNLVNVIPTTDTSIRAPRVKTQPVPAVFAEGADMTSGVTEPDIEAITLTPKKIGMVIKMSRELVDDSPLQVSRVLAQLVAEAIGYAEDYNIINGTPTDFTDNLEDDATASADTFDDDAETLATLTSKLYELPLDAINDAAWLINVDAAKNLAALSGNERQIFLPYDEAPRALGGSRGRLWSASREAGLRFSDGDHPG